MRILVRKWDLHITLFRLHPKTQNSLGKGNATGIQGNSNKGRHRITTKCLPGERFVATTNFCRFLQCQTAMNTFCISPRITLNLKVNLLFSFLNANLISKYRGQPTLAHTKPTVLTFRIWQIMQLTALAESFKIWEGGIISMTEQIFLIVASSQSEILPNAFFAGIRNADFWSELNGTSQRTFLLNKYKIKKWSERKNTCTMFFFYHFTTFFYYNL